jgi:acyl dehydratase
VSYAVEVIELRVSQSKPDRGIVGMLGLGTNQDGVRVISFHSATFVERRSPSPP